MSGAKVSGGGTTRRIAGLAVAFALLVAGIEALKVLVAWWQAGRPAPGFAEWLAFAVFAVAAYAWWRHSIFTCRNRACTLPATHAPQRDPPEKRR